ncbi:MAG TPA: Rieske (2Fe-2S) protein [Longimicrobiaceae bacterium]|nr:Rieske (2Fe-2S) protein [Longimicrobiaceae bacterium]
MRFNPEVGSPGPDGLPNEEQPKWRRDFPIDWPRDEYVGRRDFAKFMVLTSLAFAVGQVWIVVQNFFRSRSGAAPIRAIARVSDLPVGGWRLFNYPQTDHHAILVRLAEDRFVAYDQQCTHLLCPVVAQPERGRLHCPCHNGNFDLETGRVLSGPPPRPLARIRLEIRGGVLYATGVEERAA